MKSWHGLLAMSMMLMGVSSVVYGGTPVRKHEKALPAAAARQQPKDKDAQRSLDFQKQEAEQKGWLTTIGAWLTTSGKAVAGVFSGVGNRVKNAWVGFTKKPKKMHVCKPTEEPNRHHPKKGDTYPDKHHPKPQVCEEPKNFKPAYRPGALPSDEPTGLGEDPISEEEYNRMMDAHQKTDVVH